MKYSVLSVNKIEDDKSGKKTICNVVRSLVYRVEMSVKNEAATKIQKIYRGRRDRLYVRFYKLNHHKNVEIERQLKFLDTRVAKAKESYNIALQQKDQCAKLVVEAEKYEAQTRIERNLAGMLREDYDGFLDRNQVRKNKDLEIQEKISAYEAAMEAEAAAALEAEESAELEELQEEEEVDEEERAIHRRLSIIVDRAKETKDLGSFIDKDLSDIRNERKREETLTGETEETAAPEASVDEATSATRKGSIMRRRSSISIVTDAENEGLNSGLGSTPASPLSGRASPSKTPSKSMRGKTKSKRGEFRNNGGAGSMESDLESYHRLSMFDDSIKVSSFHDTMKEFERLDKLIVDTTASLRDEIVFGASTGPSGGQRQDLSDEIGEDNMWKSDSRRMSSMPVDSATRNIKMEKKIKTLINNPTSPVAAEAVEDNRGWGEGDDDASPTTKHTEPSGSSQYSFTPRSANAAKVGRHKQDSTSSVSGPSEGERAVTVTCSHCHAVVSVQNVSSPSGHGGAAGRRGSVIATGRRGSVMTGRRSSVSSQSLGSMQRMVIPSRRMSILAAAMEADRALVDAALPAEKRLVDPIDVTFNFMGNFLDPTELKHMAYGDLMDTVEYAEIQPDCRFVQFIDPDSRIELTRLPKKERWLVKFIRGMYDAMVDFVLDLDVEDVVTMHDQQTELRGRTGKGTRSEFINFDIWNLVNMCLPDFCYEMLCQKFGLKLIIDQAVWDIYITTNAYRRHNPEIFLFSQFLEEKLPVGDLMRVLHIRLLVTQLHVGKLYPQVFNGEKEYINLTRAKSAADVLFGRNDGTFTSECGNSTRIKRFNERCAAHAVRHVINSPKSKQIISDDTAWVDLTYFIHLCLLEVRDERESIELTRQLNDIFETADDNSDGFITKESFLLCFKDFTPTPSKRQLNQLYENITLNAGTDMMSSKAFKKAATALLNDDTKRQLVSTWESRNPNKEKVESVKEAHINANDEKLAKALAGMWTTFKEQCTKYVDRLFLDDDEGNRLRAVTIQKLVQDLQVQVSAIHVNGTSRNIVVTYRRLLHCLLIMQEETALKQLVKYQTSASHTLVEANVWIIHQLEAVVLKWWDDDRQYMSSLLDKKKKGKRGESEAGKEHQQTTNGEKIIVEPPPNA